MTLAEGTCVSILPAGHLDTALTDLDGSIRQEAVPPQIGLGS